MARPPRSKAKRRNRRRKRRLRKRRNRKLPVYRGKFKRVQAERLLWRAGVGPRAGEARALSRLKMGAAVRTLTRPGPESPQGPPPHKENGQPLEPDDKIGWWLDLMVRTNRPLVERMTLIWHDWFATSDTEVVVPQHMIDQNQLFRTHALGSFADLFMAVTIDPAMLIWQNGNVNRKDAPNENYAREMMELFSLGVNRGYTERDVRELARALTGWTNDYVLSRPANFHYDPSLHDDGVKVIFGKRGQFGWEDAVRLCLNHPAHASFFVRKLWSYFIPSPPSRRTQRKLERLYRAKNFAIRPVVEAILRHPAFYEGRRMVMPPTIYLTGLHRAKGKGVDSEEWAQYLSHCGQRLFKPPNVAGWNDNRWLDSGTWLARWQMAAKVVDGYPTSVAPGETLTPRQLLNRALNFWSRPRLLPSTRKVLLQFAASSLQDAKAIPTAAPAYPAYIERSLRILIAVAPEFQTA